MILFSFVDFSNKVLYLALLFEEACLDSQAGLSQQKPVSVSRILYSCFHAACLFELMSVTRAVYGKKCPV